jgi:hypothetical protein
MKFGHSSDKTFSCVVSDIYDYMSFSQIIIGVDVSVFHSLVLVLNAVTVSINSLCFFFISVIQHKIFCFVYFPYCRPCEIGWENC